MPKPPTIPPQGRCTHCGRYTLWRCRDCKAEKGEVFVCHSCAREHDKLHPETNTGVSLPGPK